MTFSWLTDTVTTDVERAVHYTLLWGLEAVDLRLVEGARVPHVNEEKLKRRLEDAELPVAAIEPGLFEGLVADRAAWLNDLALLPESTRFCRRMECPIVVVGGFAAGDDDDDLELAADAYRRAGKVAARDGVSLAILNAHDALMKTGQQLSTLLQMVDLPNVGAAWDPAAALRAGESPSAGLHAIARRVMHVRCSDGSSGAGGWMPAAIGSGDVGWEDQLRILAEAEYDGALALEMVVEPRKKQAVRVATWVIRAWREAERAAKGS